MDDGVSFVANRNISVTWDIVCSERNNPEICPERLKQLQETMQKHLEFQRDRMFRVEESRWRQMLGLIDRCEFHESLRRNKIIAEIDKQLQSEQADK
jgi:hypothetical protein